MDEIAFSAEVDLIAKGDRDRGELLNAIGQDSQFHETHGYYADPVDMKTAILPKGWEGRLVNLPPGDTEGVTALCLEPHDLAISKYVARREKDMAFTRELARHRLVERDKLLALVGVTPVPDVVKVRVKANIEQDFRTAPGPKPTRKRK
jgi:hypothetical protein